MGRHPDLNYPQQREHPRYLDIGPSMSRDEVRLAAKHARRQKDRRASRRARLGTYDAPFELWRLFPGNRSLDMLHLILTYRPETPAEVDALGEYLWGNNLVGELLAHERSSAKARSCSDLYDSPAQAADMYALYMQAVHHLWARGNGAQYAPEGADARGLSLPHFLEVLGYGGCDILLEPRMRYDGERGWAAIAVAHDARAHWEATVRDNDCLFRRAIPGDDMHTARAQYGSVCYELLDRDGRVALWEEVGDAFTDLQPWVGMDRFGHVERLHDVRFHIMPQRAIYVEMIDPTERYQLFRQRWATSVPGVLWRPLRHRLFLLDEHGNPGDEVGFYVGEDLPLKERTSEAVVARMAANTPGGLECYGHLPNGITRYRAPLNGRIRKSRRGGRTQADSMAAEVPHRGA